jgi:uncharacterized protein YndB with AHSA1/START domain
MTPPGTTSSKTIDLTFELDASADKVWRALTTPALLARWLGPNDIEPVVGARFTVKPGPAANDNAEVACEVLTLEPGRLLRLSWREGAEAIDSVVTFALTDRADGGVRLRLTHEGFVTQGGLPAPLTFDPVGAGGWRMAWAA